MGKDIFLLLIPVLKRWPIVMGCLVLAVGAARYSIRYATPMYESSALIKLDDQDFGLSNSNLYKDFDYFSTVNKIGGEVELLKSDLLLERCIEKTGMDVRYFRVGQVKKTELYDDVPFIVNYDPNQEDLYGRTFMLTLQKDERYQLKFQYKETEVVYQSKLDSTLMTAFGAMIINRNVNFEKSAFADNYEFSINSKKQLIGSVIRPNLAVKEIDKEIPVIRISYKDILPKRAAALVNAIAEVYIGDYVSSKSEAARQTLRFIDDQLDQISKTLGSSEGALERFKLDNDVVNTVQETETGLKEISQLRIQETNLDMNVKALTDMYEWVNNNPDFTTSVPSFGYGDLLFTELMKRLRDNLDERKTLLTKYTEDHSSVKIVDQKIVEIRRQLLAGIKQGLDELEIKRTELRAQLDQASRQFDKLPTREKNHMILERDFRLNEKIYNFLAEKKTEAAIAKAANISFHRVIRKGEPSQTPVSPNKTLITMAAGLVGILMGILLAIFYDRLFRPYLTVGRIKEQSQWPVFISNRRMMSGRSNTDSFLMVCSRWVKAYHEFNHPVVVVMCPVTPRISTQPVRTLVRNFCRQAGLHYEEVNSEDKVSIRSLRRPGTRGLILIDSRSVIHDPSAIPDLLEADDVCLIVKNGACNMEDLATTEKTLLQVLDRPCNWVLSK